MSGIVLRWGVPALITVVAGTSLAISAAGAGMVADLGTRAATALDVSDYAWASVSFDGRDAVLMGTASDQEQVDAALAQVAAIHGVRSVTAQVVLAERVSPFPFTAVVKDGTIALSGGVPDERSHADLVLRTSSTDDSLRLLAGAPPRDDWQAALEYGFAHLAQFDEGSFSLADLSVSIEGRAKSPEAFDALTILAEGPVPAGAAVVKRDIAPALASPFEWNASFDGRTLAVSGFTPTEDFAEQLRVSGVGGYPVSTSLVLASGAPPEFERTALLLLENLVRLEEGSASISDGDASLSGSPPDQSTIDSIRLAMSPADVTIDFAPPRVTSYAFTAIRIDGVVTLDGFVPDEETRKRLAATEGRDASALELARGAPERFDSGVEFGLDLLDHMSEGRFTLENTTLAVEGRAMTAADFEDMETTLALGAPQGLILASAAVRPPLASPFVWSAEKAADGGVRIEGFVPSTAIREVLREAANEVESDISVLADGNPPNFDTEAATALAMLPLLTTGKIEYDGARWTMTGTVDTPLESAAASKAFRDTGLTEAGWSFVVEQPDQPAAVTLPIIDPYTLRIEKADDGRVTLAGFAPTDGFRQILGKRAGEDAVNRLELGRGQPADFVTGAIAGVEILLTLEQGTLTFDGGTWSLSGEVETSNDRIAAERRLEAAVNADAWKLAIQARDAAPVMSPYMWSATKAADGSVSLAGYVTTDELKRFVIVRVGTLGSDEMTLASGEPVGFVADILAGLEALGHLSTGSVKYENGAWSLSGTTASQADADLALASLATATSGGADWVKDLAVPEAAVASTAAEATAVEPAVEPAAEPATEPEQVASLPEPAEIAPTAPEAQVARGFTFSAMKPIDGAIELAGVVPTDQMRRFFGVIAGHVPSEGLTLSATLPQDFYPAADAGIRLLASVDAGEFGLEGERWVFNGRVETDAQRNSALAAIAALPQAADWDTAVTLLPPIDVCRRKVGAFASRNAILFQSGSARIADASFVAIDELAGYLTACPEATVHVEGHTDADGDEQLNLALSVARAESVVDALIERGVGYERLYAIGYGESLPVADNDTTAGKRANRRIAFTVLDEHQ